MCTMKLAGNQVDVVVLVPSARVSERQAQVEQWAEAVIDKNRFSIIDRVLSRFEKVDGRFPSADTLSQWGGDIVAIANAFEDGLTHRAFRKALKKGLDLRAFSEAVAFGLDCRAFSKAVMIGLNVPEFNEAVHNGMGVQDFGNMLDSLDIMTFNGAIEQYNDNAEEVATNPDPIERAFAQMGYEEFDLCLS